MFKNLLLLQLKEEVSINNKTLMEYILHAPLTFLLLQDDSDIIKKANELLPYSIGIEIECSFKDTFNLENFKSIPDIIEVSNSFEEIRFRIPNGVKGLICLYNISEQLVFNCELNLGSGNHYHVDMTDCFSLLNNNMIVKNSEWILKELDNWKYKGTYNSRKCEFTISHNWIRFQQNFKTAEIRIGEMTFNYNLLMKRILSCNLIVRKIKDSLNIDFSSITYSNFNVEEIKNYFKTRPFLDQKNVNLINKLKQLEIKEEEKSKDIFDDEIKNFMKNRIVKI